VSWEAWLTAALILSMLAALGSGRFAADAVVVCVVLVLLLTGIVSPAEAVRGFSNPGVLTVAALYVVACGLKETGAMAWVTRRVMGRPGSPLSAQARVILPVAGLSAFINNTPIVAMFMPVLTGLCRRTGIAPSSLFLPLSYAAILGGVCTLIGTSTNVVVAGLIDSHNARAGDTGAKLPALGMFTITAVGLPVALAGIAYMLLFGRRLLPRRRDHAADLGEAKQYTTAMRVAPDAPIIGKTVEQAGLRHLPKLFLARLQRDDDDHPAAPETVLRAGDTLFFVGVLDSVVDLQRIRGLVPTGRGDEPAQRHGLKLVEAVVSPASPLAGQSVRDGGFRTRYGAVIIGVHRHGERLSGKIGDIVLRPGDTLLIEAEPDFARRFKDTTDFYLVSEIEGAAAPRHDRAPAALAIFAGLVVCLALSTMDLGPISARMPDEFVIALAAGMLMLLARCCSSSQARAALDWQVLIVIAASFAVGRAMESTGLAGVIASSITAWAAPFGPVPLLAAVYALTVVFTALVNNNACAVLMFPIVVVVARSQGLDPLPFILCMTVAASCEFTTPIGYQTNLMVMGPGGYRWLDYIRFGLPLTVLCGVVAVAAAAVWFRL
jgi:di/tricarboxylate transporter